MWAGILIGVGLVLILSKLSIRKQLWITTNEVAADSLIFLFVLLIHGVIGGGVDGVVHAAIASAVTAIYTSVLKKRIGYWGLDGYIPGTRDVTSQL